MTSPHTSPHTSPPAGTNPTETTDPTTTTRDEGTPPPGPGPKNAITDVSGIRVGQYHYRGTGYATGTTVLHVPNSTVCGVDVRGGAPGTRETDLLSPSHSNPGVDAIVLSGGSAYGLATAHGVMHWLEEHGQGYQIGDGVVPIVPAAIIFDLGRAGPGTFGNRPTADWGYRAIDTATTGQVDQGTVGAGTGGSTSGLQGGLGTASTVLEDGTVVGAIVVVNAAGSVVDADNRLYGAAYGYPGEFPDHAIPTNHTHPQTSPQARVAGDTSDPDPLGNTTIAAVATDASLEKAAAGRMAMIAHDGMARAIQPAHTLGDGDTIFALATGSSEPLRVNNRDDRRSLNQIFNGAADALARAIAHAIIHARSLDGGPPAWIDTLAD